MRDLNYCEEKIYLSYNRQDSPAAKWITKNLELNGFPVYIGADDLEFGIDYASATLGAISNSHIIIAIISQTALNSLWVLKELTIASKSNKKILVILAGTIKVEDIPESIQYYSIAYLSRLQKHPEELLDIIQKLVTGYHQSIAVPPNPPNKSNIVPKTSRHRIIVSLSLSAIAILFFVGLFMISSRPSPFCCPPSKVVDSDSTELSIKHDAMPSFEGTKHITIVQQLKSNEFDRLIAFILILIPLSLIVWVICLYVHIKKRKHLLYFFSDTKVKLQIAQSEYIIEENNYVNLSLSNQDDSIRLIYNKYNGWRQVNCFIAGSTKLQSERDAIRSSISIACNRWSRKKFQILSYTYEDFNRKFTENGQQSLYDTFITKEADYAIFIIKGDVGDFTISEFDKAYSAFKNRGKPSIVVYNHYSDEETESANILRERVRAIKQYWIDYLDLNEMRMHFLDMISTELFNMFEKELGE